MKTKKYLNFSYIRQLLPSFFNKIPEQRQRSKVNVSIHDAMMSGFACMYFQQF